MKLRILVLGAAVGLGLTMLMSCEKEVITPNVLEPSASSITSTIDSKPSQTKDAVLINDLLSFTYGTWRTNYKEQKFEGSTQWVADNGNNENMMWEITPTEFNGESYTWDISHNTFSTYFNDFAVVELEMVNGTMILYTMVGDNMSIRYTLQRI